MVQKEEINLLDEYLFYSLKEENTFENFIQKEKNNAYECCFSAAKNIDSKPKYNPIFIYGETGYGKTHLIQAIGNYIKKNNPNVKICYTSGLYFSDLYIKSIINNNIHKFRNQLKKYDIFLLDDIEFLINKENTLAELFHIFNVLENTQKQIILTGNCSPKNLNLDHRILSKIKQGLIIEITKPDYETRIAILENLCKKENICFSHEILKYIASEITDNISSLKGALNRLIFEKNAGKEKITLTETEKLLKDYESNPKIENTKKTVKKIIEETALSFNINKEDIIGADKSKNILTARQTAVYLTKKITDLTYTEIGKYFGNRNHATIIHLINKTEEKIKNESDFKKIIDQLTQKLHN